MDQLPRDRVSLKDALRSAAGIQGSNCLDPHFDPLLGVLSDFKPGFHLSVNPADNRPV
jgi:hypothetical protein